MSFTFVNSFEVYAAGDFFFFDFIFLLVFLVFPSWMKGKEFQMAKLGGDLWTVPALVMLQQLPIKKDVIVKSRFLIYGIHSAVFQLLLLIALPTFSTEFRELVTPLSLIAFVIIWMSLSVAAGFVMVASEAGGNFGTKAFLAAWLWIALAVAAMYFLFPVLFPEGFVMWTIHVAGDWPFLVIPAAILLGYGGWRYWQYVMKRDMAKADYL